MLPVLQKTIEECPVGNLTFLVTAFDKPFTVNGLGNKMAVWCDQAGLPHCSTHGLRKAGASIAAENGATDEELMAIYGWVTKAQTALTRKRLTVGAPVGLLRSSFRNKEALKLSHTLRGW